MTTLRSTNVPRTCGPSACRLASGIGAIDLRVDRGAIYATFTLGGLATDADGAALDSDSHRISGLYAVGRTAASLVRLPANRR